MLSPHKYLMSSYYIPGIILSTSGGGERRRGRRKLPRGETRFHNLTRLPGERGGEERKTEREKEFLKNILSR